MAAVALPQAAHAADGSADSSAKTKVAVGGFEGVKSDEARSAFISALKNDGGYDVTDAEDIKPSAKPAAIKEAAKGLDVDVVITGKVAKGSLKLKVSKASGKSVGDFEIKGTGNKLKSAIDKTGADTVGDALGKSKPKPAKEEKKAKAEEPAAADEEKKDDDEEKKDDDEEKKDDAPAKSSSDNGKGLSPLDIMAGLRPMHRTFEFHQTIADVRPNQGFSPLLKYELPLGPTLFIDLNWFPASHATTGPAEWIGLTGGFEKAFATQSVYTSNGVETTLKTNEQAFYVGARFRLPVAAHMLGLTGTYGQHSFELIGDEGAGIAGSKTSPLVPDLKYGYVKVGLDGTFRFGDFIAGAHVGKRFVMSTGQSLGVVWGFPNAKVSSLEAGAMVGYRLVSMLDLVAGFDWLRYAFDFNPVPAKTNPNTYSFIAGGAVDQYIAGYLAFRFHIPGGSESSGSE